MYNLIINTAIDSSIFDFVSLRDVRVATNVLKLKIDSVEPDISVQFLYFNTNYQDIIGLVLVVFITPLLDLFI
jgi:hypothetical protein